MHSRPLKQISQHQTQSNLRTNEEEEERERSSRPAGTKKGKEKNQAESNLSEREVDSIAEEIVIAARWYRSHCASPEKEERKKGGAERFEEKKEERKNKKKSLKESSQSDGSK